MAVNVIGMKTKAMGEEVLSSRCRSLIKLTSEPKANHLDTYLLQIAFTIPRWAVPDSLPSRTEPRARTDTAAASQQETTDKHTLQSPRRMTQMPEGRPATRILGLTSSYLALTAKKEAMLRRNLFHGTWQRTRLRRGRRSGHLEGIRKGGQRRSSGFA